MTTAQHIRNLLKVYDWGTPEDRLQACASYERYHDLIAIVAEETGHPLPVAVGVFSALSPNNSYVSNLRNCRTLLLAEKNGKTINDFRVNTYDSSKRKAWAMARDKVDPLKLFKGLKTSAFYLNCLDPTNPHPITVDGHMYWVWMGKKGVVKTRGPGKSDYRPKRLSFEPVELTMWLLDSDRNEPKQKPAPTGPARSEIAPPHLSPKMYEEISDGIRLVAELRDVIGNQAQAVLWQNWRRMHNVMGSAQSEFLAQDVFATGNHQHKHATNGGCGQ